MLVIFNYVLETTDIHKKALAYVARAIEDYITIKVLCHAGKTRDSEEGV